MKLAGNVFEIENYAHTPARRGHRFRCQICSKMIADGERVIVERRPGGAHGYHGSCFDRSATSSQISTLAQAVIAREHERQWRRRSEGMRRS